MSLKTVLEIRDAPARHWVGDGFPVHGLFGYNGPGVPQRSPFLMLDYAAPFDFTPSAQRRGVGQHPHRGFETVTIVYAGELEHRDSTGQGGVIGPGDVQWMTAGAGILHEEFHTPAFSQRGGTFEVAQLWVNLPARSKGTPAAYQSLTADRIPAVPLPGGGGQVRVIAGQFDGHSGPAGTHTPMHVWDVRLEAGQRADLSQPDGWTTVVVVLSGTVQINDASVLRGKQFATLSQAGSGLVIEANADAKLLVLAGAPIDEPVVGYGPFVMNSPQEIQQAIVDFNSGHFGQMHG